MPRGRKRTGSMRVPLAVYLTPDLMEALKRKAIDERRSISMQAYVYIEKGLQKKGRLTLGRVASE